MPFLEDVITDRDTAVMEFTKFHNRYYESPHGNQSSEWLLKQVKSAIVAGGAKQVTVAPFRHDWDQNSIIATIPGQSNKTIIIGAHQDSVNLVSIGSVISSDLGLPDHSESSPEAELTNSALWNRRTPRTEALLVLVRLLLQYVLRVLANPI